MAPPLTPPAPGVAVVQVLAPPSLQTPQTPARRAHVAIYTGMIASELARVLHSVLELPACAECTGFLVVDAHSVSHHTHHYHQQRVVKTKSKKKNNKASSHGVRDSSTYQRIVPLSLACIAPDLLATPSGYVTALVAHPETNAQRANGSDSAQPLANGRRDFRTASRSLTVSDASADDEPVDSSDAAARVARFVAAVCDDQALSKFEAAVLAELCDQQPARVLRAMRSRQSVAHKRQFLLDLVRSSESLGTTSQSSPPPPPPTLSVLNGSAAPPVVANAQVALVYNKLVAIARTGFSPQMQSDVLAAAAAYRDARAAAPPSDASLSAILELLGVVERLLRKHALPEERVAYVVRLVLSDNRLLLSALQSYRLDASSADLEKAVTQIAALGAEPASDRRVNNGSGTTKSPRKRASPRKSASPRKAPAVQTLRGFVARPIDLLHSLHQKALLTSLEYDILGALVKQQDAQVLAAVDDFQRTRDVATLRDVLVGVVAEITAELGDDERAAQFVRSVRDDGALDAAITPDWQGHLMRYVRHWGDRSALEPEHVEVLERLVRARHNLLQSAFEVFASDADERELLDTLQRIAKLQLQADDGAALQQFSAVVDAHCDVLRANEKALVKQLFVRRDELVRAAWDVFVLERNAHDLGDTLLRIARFSRRADAKLRLAAVVGEMLQRELLRSHEADGLLQLYEQRHDAMLAAAEAFESDGDVQELVETLLLVVKHAGFGDAPACSSPRHNRTSTNTSTSAGVGGGGAQLPPPSPAFSIERFDAGAEEHAGVQLLDALSDAGQLEDWQRELLLSLLAHSDDRLLAALDVLRDDGDARECVDTLERLCDLLVWEEHGRSLMREWVAPLELDGAVPRGVLQQLIAARDDRVFAAFVVYLGDGNDDEFADSLQRIARLAAAQAATQASDSNDLEPADRLRLDAVLAALVQDSLLSADAWRVIETLLDGAAHAQVLAAADVFDATGDRADFADTLERIVTREAAAATVPSVPSASRIARMEKQLLHFASELSLAPAQLAALKRSIARQDEILAAAVEVFEVEQDEEDLKDTLKRVAHHIVSTEQ